MAAQGFEIQASGAQTASAQSGSQRLGTATMGVLYLEVTTVSGTTPQMAVWLEGSRGGNYSWFEVPSSVAFADAAAAQAQPTAGVINNRNVNGATVISAAGLWIARYDYLPFLYIRAAWNITGTGPSFTFSIQMDVK